MKKSVTLYIQRLIALVMVVLATVYVLQFLAFYIIVPFGLLVYAFMHFRIIGEKPPYLYNLKSADEYLNRKNSLWGFFRLLVTFIGLIYDIVVWILWGIYLIFELFIDLLYFIKIIFYWIIHAIIWFLKQLVPPFIFLYRMFIHYCIKWIWWLYQLAFKTVGPSVKLNYYLVSFYGSVIALFCVFFFYWLDILVGTSGLIFIGIVLAALPIAWSFGEISSINEKMLENEPYYEVSSNFENGFESVKYVLYYVVAFLVLFFVQVLLDLFNWIPDIGLTLMGITINVNTLISLLLIFIFIIILFSVSIIPTHILKSEEQETPMHNVLHFFKTIINRGLRYILIPVPSGFFSIILIIIPAIIMTLAMRGTFTIKDNLLERRRTQLVEKKKDYTDVIEQYKIEKKIDKLKLYKYFPEVAILANVMPDYYKSKTHTAIDETKILDFSYYKDEISYIDKTIENQQGNLGALKATNESQVADLNKKIKSAQDEKNVVNSNILNAELTKVKTDYQKQKENVQVAIKMAEIDRQYFNNIKKQLPIKLFFVAVWLAIFAGAVLAFIISYLGNVFYHLYSLKEDEQPTYWANVIKDINQEDSKQPLLGFTLLAIIGIIIFIFAGYFSFKGGIGIMLH